MSIPDYISPIVGYRVWKWDAAGLKSLNGEPWLPQRRLAATCRASAFGVAVGRAGAAHGAHDVPQADCACGIYAARSLDHLRSAGYERYGIHGEVHLWGTVVEHELGWRVQFAYPKSFVLLLETIPLGVETLESRLQSLVAYGCDIFLFGKDGNVPLGVRGTGYDPIGLDLLIEKCKSWYAQHAREQRIKRGDRVAVLGLGIAVVEQVDGKWIRAVLWNKSSLKIARVCVRWDAQNVRWETSPLACVEANGKA